MFNRQDYAIAALVGFLAGVFAIPTLVNLGLRSRPILVVLPLAVPALFFVGMRVAAVLSRWLPFMTQLGKFAVVGLLNTAIDFGVLNLLSAATGVTAGLVVGGVNVPGFSIAVLNSYFWNKFWVFRGREGALHDFPKFIAVSVVGLLLNSTIIILATTYVPTFPGLSSALWLNFAKVLATLLALVWNFLGYKFIVFSKLPS